MPIRTYHHTYLANAVQNRNAIEPYRKWIGGKLGISLSDAAILYSDVQFHHAAVPHLLKVESSTSKITLRRTHQRIESAEMMAGHLPLLGVVRDDDPDEEDDDRGPTSLFRLEWCDGPLLLIFKGFPSRSLRCELPSMMT